MSSFSSLRWLVACTALMVGCDFDIVGGSEGQEGELEFSYSGNGLFDCLFGCDVDRPIAVGARTTLVIFEDDPQKSFTVRATDGVSAVYSESFECERTLSDGSRELRPIEPHEACAANEQRNAFRSIELEPSQSGLLLIEVLEDGALVDAIEIEAREVASARFVDDSDGEPIDELALAQSESLNLSAELLDDRGLPLYYDGLSSFAWSVDDEQVVQVDQFWLNLGPATSVALIANEVGATTVRFESLVISHDVMITVH